MVSLAPFPSPLSSVSQRLRSPHSCSVCCSHFSDGFICPHLHKKYHTPQLNEQAHLAVQASSRLRFAWPGAVIISLFLSEIGKEQVLDIAPGPGLSAVGPSWLPGPPAVSFVGPSVCVVWVGPTSPELSLAGPGLGHHQSRHFIVALQNGAGSILMATWLSLFPRLEVLESYNTVSWKGRSGNSALGRA